MKDQARQGKGYFHLFTLASSMYKITNRDTAFLQLSPPIYKELDSQAPSASRTLFLGKLGGEASRAQALASKRGSWRCKLWRDSIKGDGRVGVGGEAE